MIEPDNKQIGAQKIRFMIQHVKDLPVLPAVAQKALSGISESSFTPAVIAELVEVCPSLAQKMLYLAHTLGIDLSSVNYSLYRCVDRLPVSEICRSLLSIRVYHTPKDTPEGAVKRTDLIKHCVAVACASRLIAESPKLGIHSECAYMAGLFHDIGKLVLHELLPKGFAQIVEQAASAQMDLSVVERSTLGADHSTWGKDLAELWHLPDFIRSAIWLHHTSIGTRADRSFLLVRVVQVADMLVRGERLGDSGNRVSPESLETMAGMLGVDKSYLIDIKERLSEYTARRFQRLGLEMEAPHARLCDTTLGLAAKWYKDNSTKETEAHQLHQRSRPLEFVQALLEPLEAGSLLSHGIERLVRQWQRVYQTGKVCLLLAPQEGDHLLEAVLLDDLGGIRPLLLELPSEQTWMPANVSHQYLIHEPYDHLEWLFEQLDVDFDLSHTQWVPFLYINRPIAAIVFELNYPTPADRLKEAMQETTVLVGYLLGLFLEERSHVQGTERIVEGLLAADAVPAKEPGMSLFDALAEVAAGFAHELNNPLSVISGRAQLLSADMADEASRQILQQIRENAQEASAMVEGLLAFANPPAFRKEHVSLDQVLDEAVQLARQKLGVERLDTRVHIEPPSEVYVDSAQMASAMANIIVNGFESYPSLSGHVDIQCHGDQDHGLVRISIQDRGCGMDAATRDKAVYPFFSAKPAGRKRGMGLAYAARIIQLHGGQLDISSEDGHGTTVLVTLPLS